ncbi:hypothetical protein D3C77_397380 [compost metagenome]
MSYVAKRSSARTKRNLINAARSYHLSSYRMTELMNRHATLFFLCGFPVCPFTQHHLIDRHR